MSSIGVDPFAKDDDKKKPTEFIALPPGTHPRGEPAQPIFNEDGVNIVSYTSMVRRSYGALNRRHTYADCFRWLRLKDDGNWIVLCVLPHCSGDSREVTLSIKDLSNYWLHVDLCWPSRREETKG